MHVPDRGTRHRPDLEFFNMANQSSADFSNQDTSRGLKPPRSLFKRVKQKSRAAIASIRRRIFKGQYTAEVTSLRDSGLFDPAYYHHHYPEFIARHSDPIWHYCLYGWREGRNPSAEFDTQYYLASNPDILEAGLNPLLHYIVTGRAEQRHPNAQVHHAQISSEVEIIRESGFFDEQFYASMYPDLQPGPHGPIFHYCETGWREGRNPSDEFDTDFYLDSNPDIRDSGINPFLHYVQAGAAELRPFRPDFKIRYEDNIWFGLVESDLQFLAFYVSPDWPAFREGRAISVSYAEPPQPISELGFYELHDAAILRQQAKIATVHGVTGF